MKNSVNPVNQYHDDSKSVDNISDTATEVFGSKSVIRQVDSIIEKAVNMEASDIHLEPYEQFFRVRYRLDGVLKVIGNLPVTQKEAVISRLKILARLDIAEKRRPQDGRINFERNGQDVDLRMSTLPTSFGEKIVLRILDKSQQSLNLASLGFESEELNRFRKAIHCPYGIILVTGPTGSGKTTTLYSALNELNTPEVNITTIEDPVEYNLEGINQIQVRSDIGITFSKALRAILRQDPNIIMVGEIRDRETAEIAIRAALTGHLVFSTLHTNDAPSAVARLLDMGVEPFLAASSIRLIMAQRLVRMVCEFCGTPSTLDKEMMKEFSLEMNEVLTGAGCDKCNHTGYKGRTALVEVMTVSDKISELISGSGSISVIRDQAIKEGMQTLRKSGAEKIACQLTTPEEIFRETQL